MGAVEKFGQMEGDEGDAPDPQRHVSTSWISRAGPTALAVISRNGDIDSETEGDTGFYTGDVRVVSRLTAAINGKRTVARKAFRGEAASEFSFQLEDPAPGVTASMDYTFSEDSLFLRLRLKNTGLTDVSIAATFNSAADHFDTFYVRFPPKPERGTLHAPVKDAEGHSVRYDALDKRKMTSYLRFSEPPAHNNDGSMGFSKTLQPRRGMGDRRQGRARRRGARQAGLDEGPRRPAGGARRRLRRGRRHSHRKRGARAMAAPVARGYFHC